MEDVQNTQVPEGEVAGYGSSTSSIGAAFGDTTARIGTYKPDKVSFKTMLEMRRHFQVGAGADLVSMPLMSMPWSVEGEPREAAFLQAVVEPLFADMMKTASEAVLVGCAPHEVVYERNDYRLMDPEHDIDEVVTGWGIGKIKDIDPSSLVNILVDGYENFAGYTLSVPSGTPLEVERCFHHTHGGRYGNLWGEGRLIRTYEPWYRFMVIWDQAVRYMEKLATPPTVVYYIPGKDEDGNENRDAALAVGAGITGEETYVAMPLTKNDTDGTYEKAWDINLLKDDQRGAQYLAMLEAHAKWMLRALLIPDTVFAQNASTGSLALSQTHADTYMDATEQIGRDILNSFNRQVAPRIIRYNFGPDAPVPMLTTGGFSDEMRAFFGELVKEALRVGGISPAWDKIADRINMPLADTEDPLQTDATALAEAKRHILELGEKARESKLLLMAHV